MNCPLHEDIVLFENVYGDRGYCSRCKVWYEILLELPEIKQKI